MSDDELTELAKNIYKEVILKDGSNDGDHLINSIFANAVDKSDSVIVTEFVNEFKHDYRKKLLQNKLKMTMSELFSLPENYRQVVIPNGAKTLQDLAKNISKLKNEESSEKSLLALRKFLPMSQLRERYLTGKRMVGVAALQSVSHTLSQVAGVYLTGIYDPKRLFYLFPGTRQKEIEIRLSHNRDSQGRLHIHSKTDASGKWISELISEALTGFVDAAKDPFVFDLNLSMNTVATWFYLQKLGVPVKDIAYFFNQPILNRYFKEEAKNKSYFKATNNKKVTNFILMLKASEPFIDKIPSLKKINDAILKDLERKTL